MSKSKKIIRTVLSIFAFIIGAFGYFWIYYSRIRYVGRRFIPFSLLIRDMSRPYFWRERGAETFIYSLIVGLALAVIVFFVLTKIFSRGAKGQQGNNGVSQTGEIPASHSSAAVSKSKKIIRIVLSIFAFLFGAHSFFWYVYNGGHSIPLLSYPRFWQYLRSIGGISFYLLPSLIVGLALAIIVFVILPLIIEQIAALIHRSKARAVVGNKYTYLDEYKRSINATNYSHLTEYKRMAYSTNYTYLGEYKRTMK